MLSYAPGSRAVIRDEEWLIRRIDPANDGGWLLTCDGVSELVRGQSALFLTALETAIEVLDPERTALVPDTSPAYNASILYLESQRRRRRRHRAPLLQSTHLAAGEQAFILMGMVPNRKGQPLLVQWQVAHRSDASGPFALEDYEHFIARAGLRAGGLPNRGASAALAASCTAMQQALPQAVAALQRHMQRLQADFEAQQRQRLQGTLDELARLQERQVQQLSLELERQLETVQRGRFEQRSQHIHRVFDDYRQWVQDTLTTEPQPWIQVLAAVCHPTAVP